MSLTAFSRAWAFLQSPDIEGGAKVSDDPDDPGGLTKWGFSQRAYPDENIRGMTEARAQFLFHRDYWLVCRCDDLPDALAIAVADAALNQGPETAIRLLQQGLKVAVDGIMGPQTLAAAQTIDATSLNGILSYRLLRYSEGNLKYRRGWFLRVLRLKDAL